MANDGENLLPADIIAAIQAIRDDREHGASWLAREAARTLQQAGESRDDVTLAMWETVIRATAQALVISRPSMAAVANTAARVWSAGDAVSLSARHEAMLAMAGRLAVQDDQLQRTLLANAENLLAGDVYTMSRSGTVEDILHELGRRQSIRRVIIAESRPGGEGVALGRALADGGLPVMLVADAACGVFIGAATCVTLGADSVRADGSLVNKVGSYPLALAAREAGKPVYVLCETLKIAAPAFPLALEEKDPDEAWPDAVADLSMRNPYFDVTPAGLIAAYVTEKGALSRDEVARYAEEAGTALAHLQVS